MNSKYAICEREDIPAEEWNALVALSPDGWVFALYGWQQLTLNVRQWGLEEHSFGIRLGPRLVGAMPLQYNSTNGIMGSSGWGGCGPLSAGWLAPGQRRGVMHALIDHAVALARKRGATELSFSLSPVTRTSLEASWGVNPFLAFGFEDRSGISRVIDLSLDDAQLWRALSDTAKQAVRKARKAGCTVHAANWPDEVDSYYRLHEETYHRTGVTPHPRAYFEGIAQYLAPSGHSVLWVCRDAACHPIAYHNTARHEQGAYYHTGCSTAQALKDGANYLLFWEALLGMRAQGVRWYDCGAVFPGITEGKRHGLSVFKTKFGGENHRLFQCILSFPKHEEPKSPPAPVSISCKELLHDYLRATKHLVAATAGPKTADNITQFLYQVRSTTRDIIYASKQRALSPVHFIKPYWGKEEFALAASTDLSWNDTDEHTWQASVRGYLGIPADASIVGTGSGRTALRVCLQVLKQHHPKRRKVILPTYGCLGTLTPILQEGLEPVFIDIDDNLAQLHEQMTFLFDDTILACIAVHLCGLALPDRGLCAEARSNGVYVIEDCCQFTGGGSTDLTPDFRVFSFAPGKNVCATGGGILEIHCLHEEFSRAEHNLIPQSKTAPYIRFGEFSQKYFGEKLCFSDNTVSSANALSERYEMTSLSVLDKLIILQQLRKMKKIISKRMHHAQLLCNIIDSHKDILRRLPGEDNIWTKFSVILKDETTKGLFLAHMESHNIELEAMYTPLHMRHKSSPIIVPLHNAESIYKCVVNLPIRPNLRPWEIWRIQLAISSFCKSTYHE